MCVCVCVYVYTYTYTLLLTDHFIIFSCPKSEGDDSHAPTMCLVCGKMLCSQSYCCQSELDGKTVGAATAHAELCGAGTCLFLRCVSYQLF